MARKQQAASVLYQGDMKNDDFVFSDEGPGGLALGNPIIMNKISSFLDNRDLCRWYCSSRIFKDIIEQMDDSTRRRRTQKLAKAKDSEGIKYADFILPLIQSNVSNSKISSGYSRQ